jgi:hypothetical protein
MAIPTITQLAGIIWGEAPAIRDRVGGTTVVTSRRTFLHRQAIAFVVINRGRQGIPWGYPPNTMPPRNPTRAALADHDNVMAWYECQRAAQFAWMAHMAYPALDSPNLLSGAQYYRHSHNASTAPWNGVPWLKSFEAWDPRAWTDGSGHRHQGRPIWLKVYLDGRYLRRAIGRTSTAAGTPTTP